MIMSYQPLLVGDMTFKPASHRFIQAVILSTASMINPAFAELPVDRCEVAPATCTGAAMPEWELYDFQPRSCGYKATYGLDLFKGRVTVVALLAAW